MARIQNSPLVSIVALGVACFSTGFSLTAAAYASRSADGVVSAQPSESKLGAAGGRTCEKPADPRR
jgi:hypothetical protein